MCSSWNSNDKESTLVEDIAWCYKKKNPLPQPMLTKICAQCHLVSQEEVKLSLKLIFPVLLCCILYVFQCCLLIFVFSSNLVRVDAMVIEKTLSPDQVSFWYRRRKRYRRFKGMYLILDTCINPLQLLFAELWKYRDMFNGKGLYFILS